MISLLILEGSQYSFRAHSLNRMYLSVMFLALGGLRRLSFHEQPRVSEDTAMFGGVLLICPGFEKIF